MNKKNLLFIAVLAAMIQPMHAGNSRIGQFLCDVLQLFGPQWTNGHEKLEFEKSKDSADKDVTRKYFLKKHDTEAKSVRTDACGYKFHTTDGTHLEPAPDESKEKLARTFCTRRTDKKVEILAKQEALKDAMHFDWAKTVQGWKSKVEVPYTVTFWGAIIAASGAVGYKLYKKFGIKEIPEFDDIDDEEDEEVDGATSQKEEAKATA